MFLKLLISCALLAGANTAPTVPAEAPVVAAADSSDAESCVQTHMTQDSKFTSTATLGALHACIDAKRTAAMAEARADGEAIANLQPASVAAKPEKNYVGMAATLRAGKDKAVAAKSGTELSGKPLHEWLRAKVSCFKNKDTCVFVSNFLQLERALQNREINTVIVEKGADVRYRGGFENRVRLGQTLIVAPESQLFIEAEAVLLVFGEVVNFGFIDSDDFLFNDSDAAIVVVGSPIGQRLAAASFTNYNLVLVAGFATFGVTTTRSPVMVTNYGEMVLGNLVQVGVALTASAVEFVNYGDLFLLELDMFSATFHNKDSGFVGGLTLPGPPGDLPTSALAAGVFEGATKILNGGTMFWDELIVLNGDLLNSGDIINSEVLVMVLGRVVNTGTIKFGFDQLSFFPSQAIVVFLGTTTVNTGLFSFAPRPIPFNAALLVIGGGNFQNKGDVQGSALLVTVCGPQLIGDGVTNKGTIDVEIARFYLAPRLGQTCFTNTPEGEIKLSGSRFPGVATLFTSPATNLFGLERRGLQLDNQGKLFVENGDVNHRGRVANEGVLLVKSGKLVTSDDENCKLKSTGILQVEAPEQD